MATQTKPKPSTLVLVGKLNYSEECFKEGGCDGCAESHFGVDNYFNDKFAEEEFEYYDPEKEEYGYIPASDCDGVSMCWRNYVYDLGGIMLVFQFWEKNIKVMNEVVGTRFGITIYLLLKKSLPSP